MLIDGEEVLHIIPRLQEDAQDAVVLVAWRRRQTLGDLTLEHTGAAGDALAVVEHTEEDLRGDVVGVVADEGEGSVAREVVFDGDLEEVALDDTPLERGEMRLEVGYRLGVDLDDVRVVALLEEELGQHSHARTDLKYRQIAVAGDAVGDALGDREISEKMLA